jgi:threonine/homoserine efflux transporter RhtA
MTTRIFNALLGMWLFVTAFMWPHNQAEGTLAVVCAVLTFLLAIASFYTLAARYANLVVAAALFIGTLALPTMTRATVWNNVIVAVAILGASLLDRGPESTRRERELYGRT